MFLRLVKWLIKSQNYSYLLTFSELFYEILTKIYGVYYSIPNTGDFIILSTISRNNSWDFPGGAVVKNPPAIAGDMGSSPGPVTSHMPWSN